MEDVALQGLLRVTLNQVVDHVEPFPIEWGNEIDKQPYAYPADQQFTNGVSDPVEKGLHAFVGIGKVDGE